MDEGDDAAALEASLIENFARKDPDEVSLWETFTRLVKEGRKPEEIAGTFGLSDREVRRVLALGNLLPRIRELYRKEEIDPGTVRHLTLASRAKQREWLALFRSPDSYAPTGSNLKRWLFGGEVIPTKAAIFPLDAYQGEVVSDLFGEESYFANAEAFWAAQMAAVEERRAAYQAAGWQQVEVLPTGTYFERWQYEKVAKGKGGAVYVCVSRRGEVEAFEGYLPRKQLERELVREKPARPELTAPLRNYTDLHRHAAVRSVLADHPAVAFRLLVAHAICGSSLWRVEPEPQRAHSPAIEESVRACASEAAFDAKRRSVLGLLGFYAGAQSLTRVRGTSLTEVFQKLQQLSDGEVMKIAAVVMAETLEVGSTLIDGLGTTLQVEICCVWTPDGVFYDLLRDRRVVEAMLAEVAGASVAKPRSGATLKLQKAIIRDCLSGANGRTKIEDWLPRWMRFPAAEYLNFGAALKAGQQE
jgi:ParB family chromosome partitioning protein